MPVWLGCGHRAVIARELAACRVLFCMECRTAQPFVTEAALT